MNIIQFWSWSQHCGIFTNIHFRLDYYKDFYKSPIKNLKKKMNKILIIILISCMNKIVNTPTVLIKETMSRPEVGYDNYNNNNNNNNNNSSRLVVTNTHFPVGLLKRLL